MRINTNIGAINAQRNLTTVQNALGKSVERLSSGLRINRAADDAAGLSISEKLRGQSRGLNQAVRNAQDGISMIQTAEGGLNETHAILQRMRELAVQAANDTLTNSDRGAIASELTALRDEVDRIAGNTEFNTKKLLNGSIVTTNNGVAATNLVANESLASGVSVSALDVTKAQAGITYTLAAGATGSDLRISATIGGNTVSQEIRLSDMILTPGSQNLNFSTLGISISLSGSGAGAGASGLVSQLTVAGANNTIVTAGSGSASFQVGANSGQTVSLAVESSMSNASNAGVSANFGDSGSGVGWNNLSTSVGSFALSTSSQDAQKLINSLDDAIADISRNRSNLGAVQNRLEHTIENLSTSSENLVASESRIRDADMAQEMVGFTRSNILQQAGTSILAQANQLPQGILSLLK